MATKAKGRKTPSEVISRILTAAMAAEEVTVQELAKRTQFHSNTIYSDLKDADKIPLSRLWKYFLALGIPIDDGIQAFADSFARSLTTR